MKRLSETELKVMEKIWSAPEGIETDVIYGYFKEEYAVSTIGTILKRILQKECAVKYRKGLHHVFVPICTKEEYGRVIEEQEMSKVVGKIEPVLAAFYGREKLSEGQAEQLRKMLRDMADDR